MPPSFEFREEDIGSVGSDTTATMERPSVVHELFNDMKFCDVIFDVGMPNDKIPAHRAILATKSEVFEEMLFSTTPVPTQISVSDVESDIFRIMLRFVYTDEIDNLDGNNALKVLRVAHKFKLDDLIQASLEQIAEALDNDNRNMERIIEHMITANSLEEEDLMDKCLELVDDAASAFFSCDGLASVPRRCMEAIIRRDSITCSEYTLYKGITRWADAQCIQLKKSTSSENQRSVLGDMVMQIRFPLMSPEELRTGPITDKFLTLEETAELLLYMMNVKDVETRFPVDTRDNDLHLRNLTGRTESIRRGNGQIVSDVVTEQLALIIAGCTVDPGCGCHCNAAHPARSVKCVARRTHEDDANSCGICRSQPAEMTFIPCGHFYACATCAGDPGFPAICPICLQEITSKVKTFPCQPEI